MEEKKVKFSDRPLRTKIIYGVVIAILIISAIVIGIISAASRSKKNDGKVDEPPIISGEGDGTEGDGTTPGDEVTPPTPGGEGEGDKKTPVLVSPVVGTVVCEHNMDTPVLSLTLGEWRVHAGVDISTEDGAAVYAAEDGTVSAIYSDPRFGYTVELTHSGGMKTRYSNLVRDDAVKLSVGDEVSSGDRIGSVGDTSSSELAEEPHLHFEVLLDGVKVDPLAHISEESKEASLGITVE